MIYRAALLSRSGPRAVNEDAVGVWTTGSDRLSAAIADGLGGMGGGSNASRLAMEIFREGINKAQKSETEIVSLLNGIHQSILKAQRLQSELSNMATTFTGIKIGGNRLVGAHCGDTRAVISRRSGIKRLTTDHSEGARLYQSGKLTKAEFDEYPRKYILDSALGMHEQPQIDGFSFEIEDGDRLFLTSDGVHQKLLLRELRQISDRHFDPKNFVEEVGATVEARTPDDNYSIVAIFS
jgi:serine/threonine protein phosphatase PrpC